MRGESTRAHDALGETVGTGCFIGGTLGTVTLVALLLGSLGGLGLGNCNFDQNAGPSAPVRDGLGVAVSGAGDEVVTVDSTAGLLDVMTDGRLHRRTPRRHD